MHDHLVSPCPASSAAPAAGSRMNVCRWPLVRRSALAALLALGSLSVPACGEVTLPDDGNDPPDAGTPTPPVPPEDLGLNDAFEVTAQLTYMGSDLPLPPGFLPERHDFVLRLDDAGSVTEGIAGVPGQVVAPRFFHLATGQRALERDFSLAAIDGAGAVLCGLGDVRYETMTLDTFDTDGDGGADLVQGTATGSISGFDIFEAGRFTATISGTLDTTPPRLFVRGSEDDQSVLGDVVVEASEPLQPATRLYMTSDVDGTRIDLLPLPEDQPAIASFAMPPDLLLSFGDTLRLQVLPEVADLAGNTGTLDTPAIATIEEPDVFPQDGFESGASVALGGDAALVASVGSVPAITGSTSLLLEPGSSATLIVPLPPDDFGARLSLQLRGLFRAPGETFLDGDVVVQVLGSPERLQAFFPNPATTEETGDAEWSHAGPVTPLEVFLPGGSTGAALVVVLRNGVSLCGSDALPDAAVLIDDVAVLSGIGLPGRTGARAGR